MKKIILLLVCIASIVCSCTSPNIRRAHELIAEYGHKADSVQVALNSIADVTEITPDEKAYIESHAYTIAYLYAIVVAENWNLTTLPLISEVENKMECTINLHVPLSPEKQVYSSMYDDMVTYKLISMLLERWVQIHQ